MLTARSAMVSNSGTARAYPRPASLRRSSAAGGGVDREDGRERVGFLRPLVRPVPLHAGEAQGDAARVAGAALDAVEGDLDDELGTDVDVVAVARGLQLQQVSRLPGQHLVGEALERLPEHDEAAALGVARAQVQV